MTKSELQYNIEYTNVLYFLYGDMIDRKRSGRTLQQTRKIIARYVRRMRALADKSGYPPQVIAFHFQYIFTQAKQNLERINDGD